MYLWRSQSSSQCGAHLKVDSHRCHPANCSQTATAKGLVAGAFIITRRDGTRVEGWSEREVGDCCYNTSQLTKFQGMLVSSLSDDETVNVDQVKWALVVEKEVWRVSERIATAVTDPK